MQIGVRNRFVFVANTKAASTSLEAALAPHAEIQRAANSPRKHIPMIEAVKVYDFLFKQEGYEPNTFFRFGVMRDPLEWIASWYRYRKGNNVQSPLPQDMDFVGFWRKNDWNITRADGAKHLQRDMFCWRKGGLAVDYIIPYGALDTDFGMICKGLNLKVNLPRLNVSTLKASGSDIPAEMEDEVRAHYAEDYDILNRLDEINAHGLERLKATRAFASKGPV